MEEDHSQSECEEFMEDFFKPTLSKVKEVEELQHTKVGCIGNILQRRDGRCIAHLQQCACA